jgi:hypothetical protein
MKGADKLLGRTAEEWFEEAVRWYLEGHQGCPCCGGQHCVFRSQWGRRIEYYCTGCDFSVGQDTASRRCTASRGESLPAASLFPGRDSRLKLPSPVAHTA